MTVLPRRDEKVRRVSCTEQCGEDVYELRSDRLLTGAYYRSVTMRKEIHAQEPVYPLQNKTPLHLLGPLVNLAQKALKHLLLHPAPLLIDSRNQPRQLFVDIRLVLFVPPRNVDRFLLVHLLDLGFALGVLATVVFIEDRALFWGRNGQGGVDVPRALVVEDVSTDLANHFGGAVAVEIVVLDLEVFAERNEDGEGEVVCCLVGDAALGC